MSVEVDGAVTEAQNMCNVCIIVEVHSLIQNYPVKLPLFLLADRSAVRLCGNSEDEDEIRHESDWTFSEMSRTGTVLTQT